ncbi:hypothetical protein CBR_g25742 [Chara braunii]|uniref:DUF659 domain-containing protein n=1 Tax=Chara braunii TaxID=69332 RepID=A0A388L675_CHABU|nr:hypothetical protein CBR_g25742 [Chara braunii]|eukprot:GBG77811.1 hypothetical protein CBR_g25742 [Chara braunii]
MAGALGRSGLRKLHVCSQRGFRPTPACRCAQHCMLKCVFCGQEFQENQYVAARHFRPGKGCPSVTDEALVDIHYNLDYKLEGKILYRVLRFEELHSPAPAMDSRMDEGGAGGAGQERGEEEVVDVDNVENEGAEAAQPGPLTRDQRKSVVHEPWGQQGRFFKYAHVSARTQAHWDAEDAAAAVGKRKEREEGVRPGGQKRPRQNTITESYSSQLKVLWSSHNEITDMETVVRTADDVVGDLAEVKAPFYVTEATIMSDGRKSQDARPIVNFLAGESRGVMMVRTMNREGERDQAPDVLVHWIKVFDDFPPRWVNDICTDSASAYIAATNMLQGPQQRPEIRQITWLSCAVHVCNKMLLDIGLSSPWSKDIIVCERAVVRFIKEHGATLHIFRGESTHMGLIYPCETRFASVFAMMERLLAVRSALERTVDGDGWGLDSSVAQLARWVRWQVRHGSWWDSMGVLVHIMEPVYDMLRKLDRGGLHMSRVVQWTQYVTRDVAREVLALPPRVAHFIMQKVQARCAHMLEPAHAAAHLLCPSRRDLRGFSQFTDLRLPPGESDSWGDFSVDMQVMLDQISAMQPKTFTPAMRRELGVSPVEAKMEVVGREATLAGTQGEAAAGESTSPGMLGEAAGREAGGGKMGGGEAAAMPREVQGLHETGVPARDDPRLLPDLPLHDGQRTEDALAETEDMPTGLEDI